MKLLIATTNRGKIREMAAILAGLPVELVLPADIGLELNVEETGLTYAENAILKAQAYCRAANQAALADDSGLEVESLDGAPGLHSARYSPLPDAQDSDRRAHLLRNLAGKPVPAGAPGWPAHFQCTVAVATPDGGLHLCEGRCDGFIIAEERGSNGFGYDPVFYLREYGKTMAELGEEVKNQISHRARALQAAVPVLRRLAG